MRELATFSLLVLLAAPTASSAQSDYLREGTIGTPPSKELTCPGEDFAFLPAQCWEGERVIFLPAPQDLQEYGYQGFYAAGRPRLESASYDELVGKIATIIAVEDEDYKWKVELQTEEGRKYVADAFDLEGRGEDANLHNIAFLRDIDAARAAYLGETLWLRRGLVYTFDAPTGEYDPFFMDKFAPVEVTDIVVGWKAHEPVRFILLDQQGQEGLLDVHMSGTNVPKKLRRHGRFSSNFLTFDPTAEYRWPDEVWAAVRTGRVLLGMTREQAWLSLGEPQDTLFFATETGSREWWVYPIHADLYFEGGVLVATED
jgi:hypothetical protein